MRRKELLMKIERRCRKCVKSFIACGAAVSMLMMSTESSAYVKTGYKFDEPRQIKYLIASSADSYATMLNNTIPTWGSYTSVSLSKTVSEIEANITIRYDDRYGNSYATTTRENRNEYIIDFHRTWKNLSKKSYQKETILHEVGHALGLDHTQEANYSCSIMWDGEGGERFHDVAYPLQDDIKGINAIYGFYGGK